MIPNKLNRSAHSQLMSPLTTALVALRLGRGDSDHYHELAGAMMVAFRAAELVPRHRQLIPEIRPALNSLNAIFDRAKQRTLADAPWSGTVDEVDNVENGIRLYEAIVRTTTAKTLRRAILRVQRDAAEAAKEAA